MEVVDSNKVLEAEAAVSELLPEDVTKWSSAKKILPVLPTKFRASNQLLDEDSDDSRDTPKKTGKHSSGDPSDDRFEGSEDKKAYKDRLSRRPSPMSAADKSSSDGGEDRRWMRRGGITGNGDLPLITISQASEGRDSLSSLNSSEEGTPPSSSVRGRRPGLIPSVSEQEEDEYVEEDEDLTIEIQDHTHFEPIRGEGEEEAEGGREEVTVQPETRDTAQIKSLTGCGAPRFRNIDESSSTEDSWDIRLGHQDLPSGRSSRQTSLQRSRAVDSTDSNTLLRPPSPEKRAKIQRLDTDSL